MKDYKQARKELAVKRLEHMVKNWHLCKSVLTEYRDEDLLHYTERMPFGKASVGVLYWLNNAGGCPEEIVKKKEELEKKYDITIYAVTHEYAEFGELWDFWCIMNEDLEYPNEEDFTDYKTVYAYVYNASDETCSEFGSIGIDVSGGGMIRTY